jgi:hypothetical protein
MTTTSDSLIESREADYRKRTTNLISYKNRTLGYTLDRLYFYLFLCIYVEIVFK